MTTTYIACLRKDAQGHLVVTFPDCPDCKATGRDLIEAADRAVDALSKHLAESVAAGVTLPVPSTFDDVLEMYGPDSSILIGVDPEQQSNPATS